MTKTFSFKKGLITKSTIIIPLIHDWEWTADFQKQTGEFLKKNGNEIVVLEFQNKPVNIKRYIFSKEKLIRKDKLGIYFLKPFHLLPLERFKLIYQINRTLSFYILAFWIKIKLNPTATILWLFHPKLVSLIMPMRQILQKVFTIYDCVDYFIVGNKKEKKTLLEKEINLLEKADIITVMSKTLKEILHKKTKKRIYKVPQMFRLEDFYKRKKTPKNFGNKPVIGYIGAINDRIDYLLLYKLINKSKEWTFVMWGPIQKKYNKDQNRIDKNIKNLLKLPNVIYGLSKYKKEIPSVISAFDVAIIPYDTKNLFNKYCFPVKLFEYLYLGKPVVSTPIKELKYFSDFVKIGSNIQDWEKYINLFLQKPNTDTINMKVKKIAIENSFQHKMISISKLIKNIDEKKSINK